MYLLAIASPNNVPANLPRSSFKIQAHAMFLDTSFNSLSTVLSNIYQSLLETATKFHHYLKCLPSGKQPQSRLLIGMASSDMLSTSYYQQWIS